MSGQESQESLSNGESGSIAGYRNHSKCESSESQDFCSVIYNENLGSRNESTLPFKRKERTGGEVCRKSYAVLQGVADLLIAGLIFSVGSSATFGFVFPAVEVLVSEIFGQGPLKNFLGANGSTQAVWLVSGAASGFSLGFTHVVVSQTFAKHLAQYTGQIAFKNVRPIGTTLVQKTGNFVVDIASLDVVVIASFTLSRCFASAMIGTTEVSPVVTQFVTSAVGGFLTGVTSLILKKIMSGSFSHVRKRPLPTGDCQTLFTIFESNLGSMIRQEDNRLWITEFLARVVGGTVFRPVSIILSALVEAELQRQRITDRGVAAVAAVCAVVSLLIGWFASIRLGACVFDSIHRNRSIEISPC